MRDLPYPSLALIADGFTDAARADRAIAAVRAGVRWVHLRDHDASLDAFDAAARTLADRMHAVDASVVVTINAHLDTAQALGAGLHVGRRGPSPSVAREALPDDVLLGYSAHEEIEAEGERAQVVDYFFFSPVYPTPSKPDHPGAGIPALRAFCEASPVPVIALGGITPERVPECRQAGARGVAVLSGIMNASAPVAATRAYLRSLATSVDGRGG